MLIEIFTNKMGLITGFREGWTSKSKNPPNPDMVFELYSTDYNRFIEKISNDPCLISKTGTTEMKFGPKLYLKFA